MESYAQASNLGQKRWLIFLAWLSMLLLSELPDIIFNSISGQIPEWLLLGKAGILALFFGLCLSSKKLQPLRSYAFVLFIFAAALTFSDWVRTSEWWSGFLGNGNPTFLTAYIKPFFRDVGVALVVIAALSIVKRHRSEFFFVKGQLDAPIEPVKWLGIHQGESWRTFGWIFAIAAALLVAFPTYLAMKFSSETLARIVPLIPAILFFAAVNAFTEETYFRASFLSTLPQAIGKGHALMLTVVLFGLAHYLYGSPPGLVGFLMTGFLAFLLGKSMLETKGFLWPWFIHFLPDVVIFASYAVYWVQNN